MADDATTPAPKKSLADFKSKAPSTKALPKTPKGATIQAIKLQAKGDW